MSHVWLDDFFRVAQIVVPAGVGAALLLFLRPLRSSRRLDGLDRALLVAAVGVLALAAYTALFTQY